MDSSAFFSPHWRVGFLFLVLYPLLPPPALLLPHHIHPYYHTSNSYIPPSLTHSDSLTHSLTHSLPHSLTHSLCLPVTHSLTSLTLPVAFAWQAWDNVHRQGVGCTPRCPAGIPLASLGLRCSAGGFCVAGVGQCALPRGRMYAPVSRRCPSGVSWSPPLCWWLLRGRRGTWR